LIVSKLFRSHIKTVTLSIYNQLMNYLIEHKFINSDQSAYLKGHSTQTCLHKVVDEWLENMNNGLITASCFLDIQKCFDTIDHKLLLQKLQRYGIRSNILKWFDSYLSDRRQQVICNGVMSNPVDISIGVPQGSVLGPLLFLLFSNDIVNFVPGARINCYADDVVVYVDGKDIDEVKCKLQKCLIEIGQWYRDNRLVINVSKSKVLLIGTRQKLSRLNIDDFNIEFNGCILERVETMRYLGLEIDEELNWNSQINNITKNVSYKIHMLRRLSSFLPESLCSKMYSTYIQPLTEYGCTIWGYSSQTNIDKIQRLQNWSARIVTGNYDFINSRGQDLVASLNWQTFDQRRDYLMSTLMFRCMNGQAPDYLTDNLNLVNEISERVTRNSQGNLLYIPLANIEKYKESFVFMGGSNWNKLCPELREASSMSSFKHLYKQNYWKRENISE